MKTGVLNLDMSPSVVNQTALLDLPKAFLSTLSKVVEVRPQFFGRSMNGEAANQLRPLLMEELGKMLSNPKYYVHCNLARQSEPIFFLDPLYVMFGGVRDFDSVLVLDVSPVTNPAWHRADVASAYEQAYMKIVSSEACCYFISENTRVTFNEFFGTQFGCENVIHLFLPEKRRVVGFAAEARYPFFLFVGSLEKRKNIVGMVKAFQASHLAGEGYKLVIVGGDGHRSNEIPKEYFVDTSIVFTGFMSDSRINELYGTASGFLYLSYLEGFGVPIVEAMHFGLPIVASTSSAIPEVLGGNGILVDPDDHLAAGARLRDVAQLTDLQRKTIACEMKKTVEQRFSREVFDKTVLNTLGQRYASLSK